MQEKVKIFFECGKTVDTRGIVGNQNFASCVSTTIRAFQQRQT